MNALPHVFAIKALEGLIRQALKLDPASAARLRALSGKRLYIETRSPHLGVHVSLDIDGVHLDLESDKHPHTTIEAPSAELLKLAMGGDVHFIGGPIKVQGDVMLVQELHAIARQLEIDWETGLAGLLGDSLSYPLSRGLKQFFGIANRFAGNMMRNTGDYLREEKELVPVRWEVDEFITDNRDLRADVDRVESRVNRLKARLDKLSGGSQGDAS